MTIKIKGKKSKTIDMEFDLDYGSNGDVDLKVNGITIAYFKQTKDKVEFKRLPLTQSDRDRIGPLCMALVMNKEKPDAHLKVSDKIGGFTGIVDHEAMCDGYLDFTNRSETK